MNKKGEVEGARKEEGEVHLHAVAPVPNIAFFSTVSFDDTAPVRPASDTQRFTERTTDKQAPSGASQASSQAVSGGKGGKPAHTGREDHGELRQRQHQLHGDAMRRGMRAARRHGHRRKPGQHSDCHHRSLLHSVRGGADWERAGHVHHRQVRQKQL